MPPLVKMDDLQNTIDRHYVMDPRGFVLHKEIYGFYKQDGNNNETEGMFTFMMTTMGFILERRADESGFKGLKRRIDNNCLQNRNPSKRSSRIEHIMSAYIDTHFGTEYLSANDKSLRAQGGCQLYRPDKLYISDDLVLIVECDENQHRSVDYSDDGQRINDISQESGIYGKQLVVIRWNPDNYNAGDGGMKSQRERLERLVSLMRKVRTKKYDDMIFIYYMYYDVDNPVVTRTYSNKFIY